MYIALSVGIGLIFSSLGAIGSAVIIYLWLPRIGRGAGAILGSLIIPALFVILLLFLLATENRQPPVGEVLAVFAIVCVPAFVVGWPFAALVLRALNRRMEQAGVSAQEMFE